jgi:hypothetical protein
MIDLAQLRLDLQSMRGQLSYWEREVENAINEQADEAKFEQSQTVARAMAHAPCSEDAGVFE